MVVYHQGMTESSSHASAGKRLHKVLRAVSSCSRPVTPVLGNAAPIPTIARQVVDHACRIPRIAAVSQLQSIFRLEQESSPNRSSYSVGPWGNQSGRASLISMADVASPSTASNHTEFDDEYRSAEHEHRGTKQGGQKKWDESLGLRATQGIQDA